ncbi:unnamed protein product, partial [Scytosiphon promiscuus]
MPVGTPSPTSAGTTPVCSNGIPGIESFKGACCDYRCGQCGGIGCSTVAIDLGLGSADCCEGTILDFGVPCGEAPCIVGGTGSPAPTPMPNTPSPVVDDDSMDVDIDG